MTQHKGRLITGHRATTTTARKTSLENKNLGNGYYFLIIASSSHPQLLTEHATNGLVEAPPVEVNIENERLTVLCVHIVAKTF